MMKVSYRCNPRHTWTWDEPYHDRQKDVPAKHRLSWADGDPTLLYSERRDRHPWSPPVHVVNEFYTVPAGATVSEVAKIVSRFLDAIATAPSCRALCSRPAAADPEHISVPSSAIDRALRVTTSCGTRVRQGRGWERRTDHRRPATCDRCNIADDQHAPARPVN